MTLFIHATYPHRQAAETAVQALLDEHVAPSQVKVVARAGRDTEFVPVHYRRKTVRDTLIGALLGAVLGGALALGGVLDMISSSSTVALVQGALGGLIFGAFVGAVRGVGFWRHRPAAHLSDNLDEVVLGVSTTAQRVESLRPILKRTGGQSIRVVQQAINPMSL